MHSLTKDRFRFFSCNISCYLWRDSVAQSEGGGTPVNRDTGGEDLGTDRGYQSLTGRGNMLDFYGHPRFSSMIGCFPSPSSRFQRQTDTTRSFILFLLVIFRCRRLHCKPLFKERNNANKSRRCTVFSPSFCWSTSPSHISRPPLPVSGGRPRTRGG
jgi:hypothetical protein